MAKTGTVIQSTGKWYKVKSDQEFLNCRLPGKFRLQKQNTTNPLAVGDLVKFETGSDGIGNITEILPRKNYIPRISARHQNTEQLLAANVDHGWIVQSVKKPRIKTGFIDRFLVTCEAYEIDAGIIFSKSDLAGKKEKGLTDDLSGIYNELGYPCIHTSVKDRESMKSLHEALFDKLNVLVGQSGVGKTSLINALDPELNLPVGEISKSTEKGKHTTTFARLVSLSGNSLIIDTPGIREFGLVNIEPAELSLFFPEMREPRENCRFYNCTHSHEPGCGVVQAFEKGDIHPERYQSYLSMLNEVSEK